MDKDSVIYNSNTCAGNRRTAVRSLLRIGITAFGVGTGSLNRQDA
jgi:hypothetical protein